MFHLEEYEEYYFCVGYVLSSSYYTATISSALRSVHGFCVRVGPHDINFVICQRSADQNLLPQGLHALQACQLHMH